MTAPAVERNLLDLHMPIDPEGSVAATAPLAWCVTGRLMEKIEEFKNPHLLIVNRTFRVEDYGTWKETVYSDKWVKVVPLANAMQYLSFTSPGENELCVYVVDLDGPPATAAIRRIRALITENALYGNSISIIGPSGRIDQLYATRVMNEKPEKLVVNVPVEMFAPPPAGWRRKIVGAFFRGKEVDQCHFRKRFMIALPLAVVVAFFGYNFKTLHALTILFFGFAKLNWAAFKDPLGRFSAVFHREESGYWFGEGERPDIGTYWRILEDEKGRSRVSIWSILNPAVLLSILALLSAAVSIGLLDVLLVIGAMILFFGMIFGLVVLIRSDFVRDARMRHEQTVAAKERERSMQILKTITCDMHLPANSVRELPKELQTVSLRFNDFKTKVCRPFAR